MLAGEPLRQIARVGIKYRATGGQALGNKGGKHIEFKVAGMIGEMKLQGISDLPDVLWGKGTGLSWILVAAKTKPPVPIYRCML